MMTEVEKRIVFITTSSEEEASTIARALVSEKLAACVNIVPSIRSIYTWKGEVCDDRETLMIAKTSADKFIDLEKRVRSLHSYEVAEVISIRVMEGSQAYLKWMDQALGNQAS